MTHPILPRRLWHETAEGRVFIEQAALIGRQEPLIILGEPGMGKTALLKWLGCQPRHAYCTARQLKNVRPDPRRLVENATTLVVDALDELSIQGEGDAVDLVLQKLGEAGYPHFVLSCRAADWRNATGVAAIREQYGDVDLLVLHLEPLTTDEIHTILVAEFGGEADKADAVVAHFTTLEGLLGNPQTLELVARVAKAGPLPHTKARLFESAVELLRKEHRDTKVDLQLDKTTALDAAGAAFATLILTGSDAVVIETAEPAEDEIPLSEATALPHALKLGSVLGSRLFATAGAANRFSYWHRRIGEYLGSRWLARQADTAMKRKRLLSLFQSYGLVPASLRGVHAWLAHHDPALAASVIAADPMGVIEYGDADELATGHARLLLDALQMLAKRNPRFHDWEQYPLKSVVQPQLLADVQTLVNDSSGEFGLRLLLLGAVKGSPIANDLRPDLVRILLDARSVFALRSRALDALVALGGEDWPSRAQTLRTRGGNDDVRLAIDIVAEIGFEPFSDALIIGLVVNQTQHEHRVIGPLWRLERAVPEGRLDALLDELVVQVAALGNRDDRPGNNELTDFGYQLIARRLAAGPVDAVKLWIWLRPFDAETGFRREAREKVHNLIRQDEQLRRAGQRLVLLDEPGSLTVWQRAVRLTSRSSGFAPTPDDIVILLQALDPAGPDEEKWRDLIQMTSHSATKGAAIREAGKRMVVARADLLAWIDGLTEAPLPEWQIRQQEEDRRKAAEREIEWQKHRQGFAKQIDAMRRGEFDAVATPARAYLGLFYDLNNEATPQDRLAQWLGHELANAAIEGFEAFLQSDAPPTAQQMAASNAESRSWNASPLIVAALAEREQKGMGFAGVSDDRLTAGFYELHRSGIDDQAKLKTLQPAIEAEMRARGLVENALRAWIEPQLEHQLENVHQLHVLMRSDENAERAADFAVEWLTRFPNMPVEPETEMIDRLIESGLLDNLRLLATARLGQSLSEQRLSNWNAVAFVADFEQQRVRLATLAATDPAWLWTIRRRIASDRGRAILAPLSVSQLVWLVTTFRTAFPNTKHPEGVWSGDTNAWDASEFLWSAVNRLADMTSDDAIAALQALCDAAADSYTTSLRVLVSEQQRKHTERRYRPPLRGAVRAIVEAKPPQTVADLQATILQLLDQVQKRIWADPADPWRGFYTDEGEPHGEERCRDHLLTMLGVRPESIDLMPEGHLADDNRADIIALLAGMRVPIEIKGQWHSALWHAADTQLDRLYATDYAAERRGIYLVLWFGRDVSESKQPKAKGRGYRRLSTSEELRLSLITASQAAQDARIAVVVLNLERRSP